MTRSKARVYCAAVLLGAWTAIAVGQGSIDMSAPSSRVAYKWLRPYPDPPFEGKLLDQSQWKLVPKNRQAEADSMLRRASWVRLTDAQAGELASVKPRSGKNAPYLLRAVGSSDATSGFGVGVQPNGDVMVAGGALSRRPLPVERHAIIVWLDRAPHEVYVAFSAVE